VNLNNYANNKNIWLILESDGWGKIHLNFSLNLLDLKLLLMANYTTLSQEMVHIG